MNEDRYQRGRSHLSVPGGDEPKLAKAVHAGADEIVLDLEDAVSPSEKDSARARAVAWLSSAGDLDVGVSVRVNAPRTPWCHTDIEACVRAGGPLRSIVLPKVESAGDIAFAERLLDGIQARGGQPEVGLQALIETATGLGSVREIASASPRVHALIIGYADLGASLRRSPVAPPESWLAAQDAVLGAARAANIAAIDGPFLGVGVEEGFQAAVRRAAELGFDGKWVIHPAQIDWVNAAFTPPPERVDWARRVLAELAEAQANGVGAIAVNGQMIDEAVAVAARQVLAQAGIGA